MIRRKLLFVTAVIFLSPVFSFAQADDTALKQKAYDLLESLSTQISTLQSAENRARIGSNIAGSIWTHDEKRARALLVAVGQDINLGLQLPETFDSEDQPKTFMVFLQLRTDTIDRIAKYDPELAFDFLKTTQPSYERMPQAGWERERALTLRLAKQIAGTNPDIALKLGRTALTLRPSDEFLTLLRPLLQKHREQGVTLYKEAVDKVRNAKLTRDFQMVAFARALARMPPPLADETAYRELIDTLFTMAFAANCDKRSWENDSHYFCTEVAPLLALLGGVDSRAAKLKHLAPQFEGNAANEDRPWDELYSELEEFVGARDYDGLLRIADKTPSMKRTVYWRAFNLARTSGDLERGQKIAAAFDGSPEEKEQMLKQIERAKDAAKLSEAEIEDIQRQLGLLTDVRKRADYLFETSLRIGVNNRALALKLLDQLTEMVETHKRGSERTEIMTAMAVVYCMEKSDRGFAIMESHMPKLNELIDAAVKLDGFDTHYVRDGEWNMSAGGNLGQFLTWISSNAPHFAWCDFDRAVNLAGQFERTEIRMMAQLKLAQGILAGPPNRIRHNWGRF